MNTFKKSEKPHHRKLVLKSGHFEMKTYIKRRRETLRKYLDKNGKELMEKPRKAGKSCKDVNKFL